MVNSELEMLREVEEAKFGARCPFDSARQATYEDGVEPTREWDEAANDAG
jgi:hypothetical protein